MRCFVTGCAGFIGSNLTDRLLALGNDVIGYDNFSTGQRSFLCQAFSHRRFQLIEGDLLNPDKLTVAMGGCEIVFHLAANADVRFGTDHPTKDLHQNTIATVNVLEAMRANNIRRIAFASTGSVYGEAEVFPTPENSSFPVQTSLYAASKLAAEGFIQAYCEGFGMQGFIFRFVSILGERYSHGHVFDFYKQLRAHPGYLDVLGNGKQRKSYLYVEDCIDAILCVIEQGSAPVSIFNLGSDEYCQVDDSIRWICEELHVKPELRYAGGDRGWIGDNPFIFLDCSKIRSLGWRPKLSIREGVVQTVRYLASNPDLLEKRA
ncbi:MAG: NAD-dependent epimerase/dehydratase family protein [Acidobacteriaceae bacterium]|nr:NAD-dependent epimerase/dehydratase family protein [Acidobacteriaceae bacterium]